MLPDPLKTLLSLDGFIIFIEGPKGSGKTNLAMLLAEVCYNYKLRDLIATNIHTESYFINKIDNFPDLEAWLKGVHGKKLYILDEAGKHIKKLRFMTEQNTKFMDLIQLIRHYDTGMIGIAPSSYFIDSSFMNTDILDARIKKLGLKTARVFDYYNNIHYFLNDLPKASIIHNPKDDALFSMERKTSFFGMERCCQIAKLYAKGNSLRSIGQQYGMRAEEVKRELRKHLKHSEYHMSQSNQEVKQIIQNP